MAKPKRIVGLRWETWQILRRIIRDYIAGRLTNRPPKPEEKRRGRGSSALIGKPATAFVAGPLTDPNNIVNLWSGDWGSKAVTGKTKKVAASLGDFGTTDFVIVAKLDGDWVASCAPPGVG